ncbi:MAG: outer membrane lipoprotein carrier protein LolA [Pseudomonadota bacterium]
MRRQQSSCFQSALSRLTAAAAIALTAGVMLLAPFRPALAATDAEVIDELSAYLNRMSTLAGDFIQVAPNGTISEGSFAIRRPGRMRFEYNPPDPTLMIVDGFWVAVLDEENDRSVDRFPLSETPLFLILRERVDLEAEGVIQDVTVEADQYRIRASDPSGEAQGDLTLIFNRNPLGLKQWIVTDALGRSTTIVLRTTKEGGPLDNDLFAIPEPERRGRD